MLLSTDEGKLFLDSGLMLVVKRLLRREVGGGVRRGNILIDLNNKDV